MIEEYIKHSREFEYMSGVERDTLRVKQNAEVFTSTNEVQRRLDKLEIDYSDMFRNENVTFLVNSCGDGQFL